MILDNPKDYLVGVSIRSTPGSVPPDLSFNWARWKIDADLSNLSKDGIERLNREFEAQTSQLKYEGDDRSWDDSDWYALANNKEEVEMLQNDLSELGINAATQEISPPESVVTTAHEEGVKDKAELEYYLNKQ